MRTVTVTSSQRQLGTKQVVLGLFAQQRSRFDIATFQTARLQSTLIRAEREPFTAHGRYSVPTHAERGKIEDFIPQKAGEVRMYYLRPTVYDYAHIGNYRTFVFQDILRRFLKLRGFKLNHVMNLTDLDDRIIANAAAPAWASATTPRNLSRRFLTIARR